MDGYMGSKSFSILSLKKGSGEKCLGGFGENIVLR